FFFFSSRRRHTRSDRDWSSDVCSSDLLRDLVKLMISAPKSLIATSLSPACSRIADRCSAAWAGKLNYAFVLLLGLSAAVQAQNRSEERRVGKECKYRRWRDPYKKTEEE